MKGFGVQAGGEARFVVFAVVEIVIGVLLLCRNSVDRCGPRVLLALFIGGMVVQMAQGNAGCQLLPPDP